MAARTDDDTLFSAGEAFLYTLTGLDEASIHRAAAWGLDKPAATARVVVVARGTALAVQVLSVDDTQAARTAPGGPAGLVPGERAASGPPSASAPAPAPGAPSAPKAGSKLLAIAVADLPYGDEARARSGDPTARLEWFVDKANDSSRYFVLRVRRGSATARVGLGFRERHIAYAFQEAINDHVARCERHAGGAAAAIDAGATEAEAEAAATEAAARAMEALEKEVGGVSLTEGATIHLNVGSAAKRASPGRRPARRAEAGGPPRLGAPRSATGPGLAPPRSAAVLSPPRSAAAAASSKAPKPAPSSKPSEAPAVPADGPAAAPGHAAAAATTEGGGQGGGAGGDSGGADDDDFGDFG